MTKTDLEELLDAIAAKAPALRNAGVTALSVDDVSIELAPRDQPETAARVQTTEDADDDDRTKRAIDQKETFGGREPPRRRRVEDPNDR